jgi:HTH-type transcriptional regulator / antitoxin HigA
MPRPTTTPPDHPGTYIAEELEARSLSQMDLAYILGMTPQQLSPIITGRQSITPSMAVALGEAFDMPAEFFANLQKLYDLQRVQPVDPGVRARATWQSVYPIREMIQRKWIEDTDTALLDLQMMRFFERNRIEDVPFIGANAEVFPHAARKSDYSSTTPIQFAWLYRVRKIAEGVSAPLYSERDLRASLDEIRAHMIDPEDVARIPEILLRCGVRFALVESLPRSKIDGVCLWIDGQPAIGMTNRLDRLDNFCFVLRHEIEHVLQKHGQKESFSPIDEIDADSMTGHAAVGDEERTANAAASEFLVSQAQVDSFIARKSPFISEKDMLAFAARMEINPAVVVGQIQNKTKNYAWLRKYQIKVRDHLLTSWKHVDGWGRVATTTL